MSLALIKLSKYVIVLSLLLAVTGLMPSRPAWFINKDRYLLVSPQACGCPCPDARIINGTLIVPERYKKMYPDIHTYEINLTNNSYMNSHISHGVYYSYYIAGEVTGVDTILCDNSGCETAAVVQVEECYAAEYQSLIIAQHNFYLILAYIINLGIILPVSIIIMLFSKKRKNTTLV